MRARNSIVSSRAEMRFSFSAWRIDRMDQLSPCPWWPAAVIIERLRSWSWRSRGSSLDYFPERGNRSGSGSGRAG